VIEAARDVPVWDDTAIICDEEGGTMTDTDAVARIPFDDGLGFSSPINPTSTVDSLDLGWHK